MAPATARELSALWTALDLTAALRPAKLLPELRTANERLPRKPDRPADR